MRTYFGDISRNVHVRKHGFIRIRQVEKVPRPVEHVQSKVSSIVEEYTQIHGSGFASERQGTSSKAIFSKKAGQRLFGEVTSKATMGSTARPAHD